jgi:hypothetical protein
VLDVDQQRAAQRQCHRLAVDQRQQVDGEGRLQRRVFEEAVEGFLGRGAALEFDDDAHALAVRFVAQVADLVQSPLARQLGDALDQGGLVELVGDLRDDDAESAVARSPRCWSRPAPGCARGQWPYA